MIWDRIIKRATGEQPKAGGDLAKATGEVARTGEVRKPLPEHTVLTVVCVDCGGEYSPDNKSCPKDGGILVSKPQPAPTSADPLVGTTFAERYSILSVLGEGAMGVVYKARHAMMDRIVAIKILKHVESSQEKMLKRFQQEARAASSLSHPNVITLYDFGICDGKAFIVMDYLEGASLEDAIQNNTCIPYQQAIRLFIQVCDGLQHAHDKGIVHRDMKPSNIVLVSSGADVPTVKIVDFGIAKLLPQANKETFHLTQAGQIFGSPLFMSPEQCLNRKIDNRTDVYSVACTLYNAITGKAPFDGSTLAEVIYKQISETPPSCREAIPDANIPMELDQLIRLCMKKDPDGRIQSMAELKEQLEKMLPTTGIPQVKSSPAPAINVLVAEDNDSVAAMITDSLNGNQNCNVVGRAKNGEDAIDKVMQLLPQVALLDIHMPILGGAEAAKQIKTSFPNMRVILYSVKDNYTEMIDALNSGADGYILKDLSAQRLLPAIKAVVNGIAWVDPEITTRVLRASAQAISKERTFDVSTRAVSNPEMNHAGFLHSLAEIYEQEKKYDEAEALYHGAVAVLEKARGRDNADVAVILMKLADLYMTRMKTVAAEQLYLRALEIRFQNLGQEHLDVAASLDSLGLLFKLSGGLLEAERFYQWALQIRQKLCEPGDPLIVSSINRLAGVYRQQGKVNEARSMERQGLAVARTKR